MLSPDILRLILGYLDFESKQKRAVLVCKQWFEIIRDNSALSGHLVLWPPTGNVTADEINEILKGKLPFTIYYVCNRVLPRFFDQVGHETMYASSGNKHFFA